MKVILNMFDGRIIETIVVKDEQEVLTTEDGIFNKDDIESIVFIERGDDSVEK